MSSASGQVSSTAEGLDETVFRTTLSPELLQKAEAELNEKDKWRDRDIQALRDMVFSHKGIAANCATIVWPYRQVLYKVITGTPAARRQSFILS